jgi:hypothetical protein
MLRVLVGLEDTGIKGGIMTKKEVKKVNGTARSKGCVGKNAVVPAMIAHTLRRLALDGHNLRGRHILDYGSGKVPRHAMDITAKTGVKIDAYDIGTNFVEGVHVKPKARQYDLIYASNVINVLPSKGATVDALREMKSFCSKVGVIVFNYPKKPRHAGLDIDDIAKLVFIVFDGYRVHYEPSVNTFSVYRPSKK